MRINSIKCEAIDVKSDTGICPGLARTKKGESTVIDGRTPEGKGMCTSAFCAISNQAFIMMVTEGLPGEQNGHMDRTCPHGAVVFRLSRSTEEKKNAFNEK